jgi:hypothetical protein
VGIHRQYARFTPDELQRALEDPGWAQERLDELGEAGIQDDSEPEEARFFDVDKAWPGIEFVLARAGLPEEAVNGTESLPTVDEWDYGPPTYLTAAQVATVAERVAVLPIVELVMAWSTGWLALRTCTRWASGTRTTATTSPTTHNDYNASTPRRRRLAMPSWSCSRRRATVVA